VAAIPGIASGFNAKISSCFHPVFAEHWWKTLPIEKEMFFSYCKSLSLSSICNISK